MSHLILGVIGIMLAAAAALIVVNYGGDYYLDAYNDGDAMNVENGLTNVLTAYRVHEMRTGSRPADMAAILPETGSGALKNLPPVRNGGSWSNEWRNLHVEGRTVPSAVIVGVDERVCMSVNARALVEGIPGQPVGALGCYQDGSQYVAYRTL